MPVLSHETVHGPCTGHADQRAYKENIQKVIRFLNGDFQETIDKLTEKNAESI